MTILGAYGTGTNWAKRTLRESGVAIYEKAGVDRSTGELKRHFFKHYVVEADTISILRPPTDVFFVCLVKSPLFWISSLHRMLAANLVPGAMRTHRSLSLSELIRAPGRMVSARRELGDKTGIETATVPELWNLYALGYTRHLPRERTLVLPYEQAVRNPRPAFEDILGRVGVAGSSLVVHSKRRMGTGHGLHDAQRYYGNDANRLEPFSDSDIAFVDQRTDATLLTELGYRLDGSI